MTINLFGYTIIIAKRRQRISLSNRKGRFTNACHLTTDGKYIYLTDPNGIVLPHQTSISLIDNMDRATTATVELLINPDFVPYKEFKRRGISEMLKNVP